MSIIPITILFIRSGMAANHLRTFTKVLCTSVHRALRFASVYPHFEQDCESANRYIGSNVPTCSREPMFLRRKISLRRSTNEINISGADEMPE